MRNWLIALLVMGLIGLGIAVSRCGRVVEEDGATTTTTTVPTISAPGNLSAEAYTLQNTLTWDPVSEAASYNLYWSTSSGVTKANGTKIAGVTSPYTHEAASSPLTNGQTYYYVATAVDAASNESVDSAQVSATPDTLGITDESFSDDGAVISNSAAGGNSSDSADSITTDSSGNVLAAGFSSNGSDYDMVIWRYDENGEPDTNFGVAGVVKHASAAGGTGEDRAHSITIDPSENIVVAGNSYNGSNQDMVIWKYDSNGSEVSAFGANGVVVHNSAAGGNGDDYGYAAITEASGDILVAGYSSNGSDVDMVVWKFNSDGSTDESFGTSGVVRVHNAAGGNSTDAGYAIAAETSGKIVVAGTSNNGSDNDMALWRFNADGTTDESFGTGGKVIHHNAAGGGSSDTAKAVTVASDGKIVVAGYSANASGNNDLVVWRFNSDGSTDESFGTSGAVVTCGYSANLGHDHPGYAVLTDSSGRIVVAGDSRATAISNTSMVIWRFNSDGSLDTGFGVNGRVITHGTAGGDMDRGEAVTLDAYGRILVAGSGLSASYNTDMILWRFK